MTAIVDAVIADTGELVARPRDGQVIPADVAVFLNNQVAAVIAPQGRGSARALRYRLPSHVVAAEIDLVDVATGVSLLARPVILETWYGLRLDRMAVVQAVVTVSFSVRDGLDRHLGFEGRGRAGPIARGVASAGEPGEGRRHYTAQAPLLRLLRRGDQLTVFPRIGGHVLPARGLLLDGNAIGIVGHLDEAVPGRISGWAADLATPHAPVCLDVVIDGETVRTIVADQLRADVRDLGIGDGCCGFDLPIDLMLRDSVPTEIAMVLAGTPTHLAGSPISVTVERDLAGCFDTFHGMSAYGWAIDRDNPDKPVLVEAIDADGRLLQTAEAKLFRGDLLDAGYAKGLCAFKLDLSTHFKRLIGTAISVRIAGSTAPLFGSPKIVTVNPNLLAFVERDRAMTDAVLGRLRRRFNHAAGQSGISLIMPVYNTNLRQLAEAIDSVSRQWCDNWELICVDDASPQPVIARLLAAYAARDQRIRVLTASENGGIARATNFGLRAARYPYVAFIDHDDYLEPDAVWQLLKAIRRSDADFLYSDEAVTGETLDDITEVRGRPAFSHDYYLSHPYFVHLLCVRTSLARVVGGWDETMPISADVDFVLRILEQASIVAHVPYILYRWRTQATSTGHAKQSQVMAATRSALQRHCDRLGAEAAVSDGAWFNQFRVEWPVPSGEILIVIPTKNKVELLKTCVSSIERTAGQTKYRIVIVDHESDDAATQRFLNQVAARHTVMRYKGAFNYSRINNAAVRKHLGNARFVLFLNNDVEAIQKGWLDRMASLAARRDVGAVGAMLLYADRRVQHAGVILGFNGSADHALKFQDAWLDENGRRNLGYNCSLTSVREFSAVTAACMMLSAASFTAVGGFDPQFGIGFNDTDLCLRIRATGRKILYDGHTILYHYESATRSETKQVFHPEDTSRLLATYASLLAAGDPFYNPNLSQTTQDHVAREDAGCRRDKPPRVTQIDLRRDLAARTAVVAPRPSRMRPSGRRVNHPDGLLPR